MSIADLFSGVLVIMIVLFAAVIALPRVTRSVHGATSATGDGGAPPPTAAQVRALEREAFLDALGQRLNPFIRDRTIRFDRPNRIVAFEDVSFQVASACLTPEASRAVAAIASTVAQQLEQDQALTVGVEGHSDALQIRRLLRGCGWFSDNTQLSTLRATGVRSVIAAGLSPEARARLPVTGWGPDRLRNTIDPYAAENRRVELRFVWLNDAPAQGEGAQAQDAGL